MALIIRKYLSLDFLRGMTVNLEFSSYESGIYICRVQNQETVVVQEFMKIEFATLE